jgi:hypothetical protein
MLCLHISRSVIQRPESALASALYLTQSGAGLAVSSQAAKWKKIIHLFTEPGFASRAVRARLPVALLNRLKIDIPMHTEDRRILERIILAHYRGDPRIKTVRFVGCDWYTAHYQRRYFAAHDDWTIDPDPTRRKFSAKQHVVRAWKSSYTSDSS